MPLQDGLVGGHRQGQSRQRHQHSVVGSVAEKKVSFPSCELGDVWAAPGGEREVEYTGGRDTALLKVENVIHHLRVC